MFHAYAAHASNSPFAAFEFDPGPLSHGDVEVAVEYCGICHSDLGMKKNEWGFTQYPFGGGHEVAGRVVALGEGVAGLDRIVLKPDAA